MKKVLLTAAFAIVFAVPARAADTHESLLEDSIKALTAFSDVLTSIKDKASSETAKPKLKEAAQKMLDLKDRSDKLGEPKGAAKDDLEKKYKGKMEEVVKKLTTEMIRISMLDGGMDIVKDLGEMLAPLNKKK